MFYWDITVSTSGDSGDSVPVLDGESWCLLTPLSIAAISGGGGWWVPTATLATNNGHNKSSDHCNKKSDWNIYFNIIIYIISREPTYMYTVSSCCLCKWVWSLDTIAAYKCSG